MRANVRVLLLVPGEFQHTCLLLAGRTYGNLALLS